MIRLESLITKIVMGRFVLGRAGIRCKAIRRNLIINMVGPSPFLGRSVQAVFSFNGPFDPET